jgi:UDP-N-acetylmuramyl pentapeptide phosphotransferase/UDP-N-acetylglucosamine-1-phosphate transferase
MVALSISFAVLATGGLLTLAVSLLLCLTQRWHGHLSLDDTHGVQKFHAVPTPRVGGLALLAGLVAAWAVAPAPLARVLGPMLLASSVAFGAGFLEDLTKRVGVRERLLATMVSGVIAAMLTGVHLDHVAVWGLDSLLAWAPAGILFTAFSVAGVANAINIIDGFHGLAGGALLIALGAMGWIAWQVGDGVVFHLCLTLGVLTTAFLLVNFPYGKLFLGDGGAYMMGFLLGWTAVLLAMRNPGVSVWAPLLCCGYPVLETLFSMARRRARACQTGQPDRLHLHSLIHLRLSRRRLKHWSPTLRNAAVSPLVWSYALLPAVLAVLFYDDTPALMAGFLFSALVYACWYTRLTHFRWKIPGLRVARSVGPN